MLYHHWTAALVSRSCLSDLSVTVQAGERRMGQWMTRQRWTAVLFDDVSMPDAFMNMNTPEDLLTSTKQGAN